MKIVNGWLDTAEHIPSPNFNERPSECSVSLLVIHNISLPPAEFGNGCVEQFFQNCLPWDQHPYFQSIKGLEVSSHFFIRRDGCIVQFVSCNDRAWHAGQSSFEGRDQCNDFSIGIELEGTDDLAYESSQYASLVQLTSVLQDAYPLISHQRIAGHCDIAPGRKTDPGESFDWDLYFKQLNAL